MHRILMILNDFQLLFLINLHYPLVNQVLKNATGPFICRKNNELKTFSLDTHWPPTKANVVEDLSI